MTRIVRTAYRYKRPPRKRQAVAIEGPAVVKAADPVKATQSAGPTASAPANDDRKPARIVTIRKPGAKDVPEMTPDEHQRRGDAAEALFRKITTAAARPSRHHEVGEPRAARGAAEPQAAQRHITASGRDQGIEHA
jgi:hypothetical protein